MASQSLDDRKKEENEKIEEVLKMKNKRLMGIIGLIAAAVIGTAIYSATAGKDNKTASSNEKAKVGVLQLVSHPSLDLIYKGIQDGLAEEGYDKDKVDIDFLNAEGDQNKVATMSKQLVDKDNQVLIGIATPSAQGLASATNCHGSYYRSGRC